MFSSFDVSTLLCAGLGLLFVAACLALPSYRYRAFMSFVPMPVSGTLGLCTNLISDSFQDGASWIWGHEKIIFDSSTSTAYTRWYVTLGTYVIRVRGALWVSATIQLITNAG